MKRRTFNRIGVVCLVLGMIGVGFGIRPAAGKKDPVPPWMEDVVERGNTTYRMPKGMKKKKVGAQWVVEDLHEYVARRIYEMNEVLETHLKQMEDRQKAFEQKTLDRIRRLEGEVEALKRRLSSDKTDTGLEEPEQ